MPELPIYETVRKIPTGRMDRRVKQKLPRVGNQVYSGLKRVEAPHDIPHQDLKERQRLREQMDMLSAQVF